VRARKNPRLAERAQGGSCGSGGFGRHCLLDDCAQTEGDRLDDMQVIFGKGVLTCAIEDEHGSAPGTTLERDGEGRTAMVADLPLENVLPLSNQANLNYISLDRVLAPNLRNAAPAINAFAAWQSGHTGAGIQVALLDSGISAHADLNGGFLGLSRVVWNQSFVSGNPNAADQYGHGTHVARLIAGDGSSSTGSGYSRRFEGIAPGAHLVNCAFSIRTARGTTAR
jgi:subtilisin family serine protease